MPTPNPRLLPPAKAATLLNSFPSQGQVVTTARIRKHLEQAGMQISNDLGETLDVLRYCAWLCFRRHSKAQPVAASGSFAEFAAKETADIARLLGELEKVV